MASRKITPNAKRKDMWALDPDECIIIGHDTDHKEGTHPLRETDDRLNAPLDETFIESIMGGIDTPIAIRRSVEGVIEVIYGRRRVLAAREANKRLLEQGKTPILVPCVLRRIDDKDAVESMISENEQRKSDTPLAKAKKLQIAYKYGHSDKSAAKAFGVSVTSIKNWKKMLELDPEVIHAVETDELKSSAAMDLAHLPKEEQVEQLEALRAKKDETGANNITVKQTTALRRKKTNSRAATPFTPPKKKLVGSLLGRSNVLSHEAMSMLRWLTGHVDADAVPGLNEALEEIEKEKAYKVSDVQQAVIDEIRQSPKLPSEVNKKTMSALGKKGIVEAVKGEDGVKIIKLTDDYLEAMGFDSDKKSDEEVEEVEEDEKGENDSAA